MVVRFLVNSPLGAELINLFATMNQNYYLYDRYTCILKLCITQNVNSVSGKKVMPDVDRLVKKIFVRKTFLPEPMGTSALFSFFAQHFTHQFFKTDLTKGPEYQWGGHGVSFLCEKQNITLVWCFL